MEHELYLRRCLQLARKGLGSTFPNPLVGSVLVRNNRIIGEGWHHCAGEPHAEVHAIASVENESDLKEATLYVSLEPCSHFGKTPPCSDLILKKGIPKVVIGTIDPFDKVAGKGIQKLKEGGCEVIVGVLAQECKQLNKRFLTFHTKKRPYVILKWAETFDGYIAPDEQKNRAPVWITNSYSQQLVHQWRAKEMAILVGSNTVTKDNPQLTTRSWFGTNPIRLVLDRSQTIAPNSRVLNNESRTLVFSAATQSPKNKANVEYLQIPAPNNEPIPQILELLYQQNIQSVIIEGGATLLKACIQQSLWDEARVFRATKTFGSGILAPKIQIPRSAHESIQGDVLSYYYQGDFAFNMH